MGLSMSKAYFREGCLTIEIMFQGVALKLRTGQYLHGTYCKSHIIYMSRKKQNQLIKALQVLATSGANKLCVL
jgi:hypothetical protein